MIKNDKDSDAGSINQKVIPKNNEIDKILLLRAINFLEFIFIFEFKNILNISKIDFMNIIMLKIKKFLSNENLYKSMEEQSINLVMNQIKEKLEKKYDNNFQNLSLGLKNFEAVIRNRNLNTINNNNENDKFYLKNFIYHCSNTTEYALHNCVKLNKKFGKYIVIKDSINNKNVNKFVICENCKQVYFIQNFLNYCEKCKINYYTCENHEKKEFFQAALKFPHCEPVVNEKLFCMYCKSVLYINPKTKVVKCLNCRYISSPNNLSWKCNICNNPFKSDVIIYNKCEVNYVKKIINFGLLTKIKAHPAKLPCCKDLDIQKTLFYHKKACKGILYFAEFHNKLILICEKCKAVNNFGKFIWTCPKCSLRFKDMKWEENESKLIREIFNDENIIIKKNSQALLNKVNKNISETNKSDINNAFFLEKNLKDNKDLSTEGSDTKNVNNVNQEFYLDNQLQDLIKVKRSNHIGKNNINDIIKKPPQNLSNMNMTNEKSNKKEFNNNHKDLVSIETNKIKKNYIFERLIGKKFIPANNLKLNSLTSEKEKENGKFIEQRNLESKQKFAILSRRKSQEIFSQNSNNKPKIIVKNRSISDLTDMPASRRKININQPTSALSSSELNITKYKKCNNDIKVSYNKDTFSDIKYCDIIINNPKDKEFNTTIQERRTVNMNIIVKKNSPKKNNYLNVKKCLFKNNCDNKEEENNNKNRQSREKNKKISNHHSELIITGFKKSNNENSNQLNQQKYEEKKINIWREINFTKNSNNKEKNICPYSSSSMIVLKNRPKNKLEKEEEKPKQKYDNSTYKIFPKNNILKNKNENEDIINIPDDIVKISSIEKMEKIPLNPAIFTNPILANNIQQRIKHVIFRGRLPIFNVDNYTIKKTLGEGTNGVIYQVMNNTSKKYYAMKKIMANSIQELDYLQKEFQICYQNPHKYVLTIYGICVRCYDANTFLLYVLMPLAEKDLEMEISERIRRKKYYKEEELITMIKQLVEVLFYLQKERNVAHRDIKPENILIFKNHVLKLADFGEAKVNNDNNKKKTIRGTEFYMSPILYEGNLKAKFDIQHNPFKSDVFSLGYCFICASSLNPEIINEIRQIKEQEKIKSILKKYFPKEYSEKYINLLLKMITLDEKERVDFIGLDKLLQNY